MHCFCVHTQEGEGLVVPGTEGHVPLFEVETCTYVRLRQLWFSITRENASLARLISKEKMYSGGFCKVRLYIYIYIKI